MTNLEFRVAIKQFAQESKEIQKEEMQLQVKSKLFNEKFGGFLKQNGLPENFTLPELCDLTLSRGNE